MGYGGSPLHKIPHHTRIRGTAISSQHKMLIKTMCYTTYVMYFPSMTATLRVFDPALSVCKVSLLKFHNTLRLWTGKYPRYALTQSGHSHHSGT